MGNNVVAELVTTALDKIAREDPQRVFAEFLEQPNLDQDVFVLTFADLANAVDRLAWWLKDKSAELGLETFDTVAYVGLPDVRYYLILLAAIKAQITLLFSAPVNDNTSHLRLMEQTRSKALLYTEEELPSNLITSCKLPSISVPSAKVLLDTTKVSNFPFEKSYEQVAKDPVVYFHTSGTTGNPKPILWTNAVLANASFGGNLANLDGRAMHSRWRPKPPGQPRRRMLSSLSAYHASMGLLLQHGIFCDTTSIVAPLHLPHPAYNHEAMARWIQKSRCDCLFTFPSRLDPALNDKSYMDELKKLDYIYTGGVALSHKLAQELTGHVHLAPSYVATEIPFFQLHAADPDAWEYVCIDSKAHGIEWRHFADDKYELVFVRNDSLSLPPQCIFQVLPDRQEHGMGDLFSPHPAKQHHWRFAGRVDDIIILSLAQNINPTPFEQQVAKHEKVRAIAMLGNGRLTPCLVLELYDPANAEAQLDEIWPAMEKAWEGASIYSRVDRSRVIIASTEKPIPKSPKGGIKRKSLESLYEREIEALY